MSVGVKLNLEGEIFMHIYKKNNAVVEKFTMERVDGGIVIAFDEGELAKVIEFDYGKDRGEFLVGVKALLELFCDVSGLYVKDEVKNEFVKFNIGEAYYSFHAIENYIETKKRYCFSYASPAGIDIVLEKNKIFVAEEMFSEFIYVVTAHEDNEKNRINM